MNTTLLWAFVNHLWQSTVFTALAGLLTLALRRNRARVRHAVWLAASLKFLLPFSLLVTLGSHLIWTVPRLSIPVAIDQVGQPFSAGMFSAAPRPAPFPIADVLVTLWACGVAGIACAWWVRWRRIQVGVRAGVPLNLDLPVPTLACANLTEPGVFGVLRPVLLLPDGIEERLTPLQFDAVLTHELEHVRHRDNLAAAFQMFVETVFWFHPLVWWIGKRMVAERERACDEAVIGAGGDRRVYAEAILNVCKFYTQSPLDCVSGVSGANLKKRIEAIMIKRTIRSLHLVEKTALALAAIATLALPVLIGMARAPLAVAQPTPAPTPVAAAQPAPQPAVRPAPQPAQQATSAFPNPAMSRIVRQYGFPDSIVMAADSQIWRYNSLADFQGKNAEFEFPVGKGRTGMRINWPPPLATFLGTAKADDAAALLANQLSREQRRTEPEAQAGQLPGGHASVLVYPSKMNVMLQIPMASLTGRTDVIGLISQQLATGERGPIAANFRDYIDNPSGTYQTNFTLEPGQYVCKLLVRENGSGQIYAEEILFEVK